jgi:Peptidase S46
MRAIGFWTALGACVLVAGAARADGGLWTFDNFPAAKVKAAYGVDITPEWLSRIQGAAVRLSVGCSASKVSAGGLVLTNDHCVSDCVQAFSTPDHDVAKQGFLAATLTEERTCPQMEADMLLEITDVTARMTSAGAGLAGEALVKARDAASAGIAQQACGADRRLHCQVVTLYQGGQYKLYKYRRYADVRLVFSPGDRAAFFGGDPDNFNFPRFDLDCAFLRLYEDGKPVATPGHLRFRPRPPVAGEPVFVPGNPGGTLRGDTLAQLETQRDALLPVRLAQLSELRGRMIRFGEESPEHARVVDEPLMELENNFKVVSGHLAALNDPAFMAAKRDEETDLKARALAKLGAGFGDPWADLAKVQASEAALYVAERQIEGGPLESSLFDYARGLVRAAAEREKPSVDRLPGYADHQLPGLEKQLLDPQPVEPALEQVGLEFWLSKSRELLTADDPSARLLLGDESPEALSARLVAGTKLGDPAVRKALWDGGAAAIAASDDPMIRFVVKIDPEARRLRAAYEDQVTGPATRAAEAIAQARFAVLGDSIYPDGTFTLRLSYGAVAGWTWRGKTVAPFTTFAGLYDRATGAPPFDLDPRWVAARPRLDPSMIFDLSTTNDIIGGNSGSPLLDAKGDVIGAVFDGNIFSLGGDFGYDGAVNRAVAVSAQAIDAALRNVYGADALARELAAD